jgi:hypothetical protein
MCHADIDIIGINGVGGHRLERPSPSRDICTIPIT